MVHLRVRRPPRLRGVRPGPDPRPAGRACRHPGTTSSRRPSTRRSMPQGASPTRPPGTAPAASRSSAPTWSAPLPRTRSPSGWSSASGWTSRWRTTSPRCASSATSTASTAGATAPSRSSTTRPAGCDRQDDVDRDRQLTAYAFACARGGLRDPATGEILPAAARLGLHFAEPGIMVWTTRSAEELEAFGVRLVAEVAAIRRREFAPRAGTACRWCEYRRPVRMRRRWRHERSAGSRGGTDRPAPCMPAVRVRERRMDPAGLPEVQR